MRSFCGWLEVASGSESLEKRQPPWEKNLKIFSNLHIDSSEVGAWSGGTIDITCIAVHASVNVLLEVVKHVLYTRINLQGIVLVERNIVAQLEVPLKERRCYNLLVLWYIARKVLHQHAARDLTIS